MSGLDATGWEGGQLGTSNQGSFDCTGDWLFMSCITTQTNSCSNFNIELQGLPFSLVGEPSGLSNTAKMVSVLGNGLHFSLNRPAVTGSSFNQVQETCWRCSGV